MLLSLLLVLLAPFTWAQISSGQVSIDPPTVGFKKASFTIQFTVFQDVPVGSLLQVIVPEGTSVTPGAVTCAIAGYQDMDGLVCSGLQDAKTLEFPIKHNLRTYRQNVFEFFKCFNAPMTSEETKSFEVRILNSDRSAVLMSTKEGIKLSLLRPNTLQSALIKQVEGGSGVVGQSTGVLVTVTPRNPIPAGGGLEIVLPKWNMQAPEPNRVSYIIQNEKICAGHQGVTDTVQCQFIGSPTQDKLIVKNLFGDKGRIAGDTFSFKINQVLNPLSMSAVEWTVTTFSGIDFESASSVTYLGVIDQGPALLQATQPVQIDPASTEVSAEVPTVQEATEIFVRFEVPVPLMLELGCTILITLPTDINILSGQLTNFNGWGMFLGVSKLVAQVNEQQRTIKIVDQCKEYTNANLQSTIKLGTVTNPTLVKQTATFKIQVQDSQGMLIAEINQGVTYTPSPGTLSQIDLEPLTVDAPTILEKTDVRLVFTPQHPLSTQAQIKIKMPQDLPVTVCDIRAVSEELTPPSALSCQVANGEFLLMNPFKNKAFGIPKQVSITFAGLTLPNSERMIKGITIETFDKAGSSLYLVDQFISRDYQFFRPEAVTFLFNKINLLNQVGQREDFTYTEAKFVFEVVSATEIPAGSSLYITLPSSIIVDNKVSVQASCGPYPPDSTQAKMAADMKCEINADVDAQNKPTGTHTITITQGFPKKVARNEDIKLWIQRGLFTPISTETTESFKILIADKDNYRVNFVNEALTITMRQGKMMSKVAVLPDSTRVGDQSDYLVSFETPVPIKAGFKLQIFVPETIITPRPEDIKCQGQQKLTPRLGCSLNGHRITHELEMTSPIKVGDTIAVKIGSFRNPGTTEPTEPFGFSIRSDSWYEVAETLSPDSGKVKMTAPSIITDFDFSVFDSRQQALTTVTINWVSTETYPLGTEIMIEYEPTQFKPQFESEDIQTVPCIFRQSRIVQCEFYDYNKIRVKDVIPSTEYEGSQMQLTITNILIDVREPMTTKSWQLFTKINEHLIDTIPDRMTLNFKCQYPCLSCKAGDPTTCLSCNTVEVELQKVESMILYNQKCYERCPPGTFFEYFQCKPCSARCQECEYLSGTSCTKCHPDSKLPFLNGKDCTAQCNYGNFGNRETGKCEACELPCETCVDTKKKCLSCKQNFLEKFYFQNQCLTECPSHYYVQLEARNNVCLECDANCKECDLTSKTCVECGDGFILNELDSTCVRQCPKDITIYTPAQKDPVTGFMQPETCQPCKTSCLTCSQTVDTCTSCRNPLSLDRTENKCVLECDIFYQKSVSVKNVCYGCSSSCETCQFTPDHCLTCTADTYFFQNSCVNPCPVIDDYQFEPNEDRVCVINTKICPFGRKLDKFTGECYLVNQICEENYELNAEKTACVPVSNFYIPFPMTIVMLLLCIGPCTSKAMPRFRKQTLLVPSLTMVVGFFETVALLVMILQAQDFGINTTKYLALVALIFIFCSNMFFTLMYCQQVTTDSAYKHWQPKNRKVTAVVSALGLVNFKMYRLLYCRLFGHSWFDAPFTEPSYFYRPFNLTSLFAIVTVTLPAIVASAIGLLYVRFGYQLYITCVEMLIIQGLLIVLQVTEYCQQKFQNKKYFKVTQKQVEVKVCSDFPDSDEYDAFETKKDRSKSKPKSIKAVRQLDQIVQRMAGKEKENANQLHQVEREIEELHQEDLMLRQFRRCHSLRELRPTVDEAFSGDESPASDFQDFISEPASPRSKEMLFNRKFLGRMHCLQDAYKMRDQFDNVYHQPVERTAKLVHPVNKKQQTNVLEMLGIDDAKNRQGLAEVSSEDEAPALKGGRRTRLSKKRIMEIPEFEYDDISGQFEADEFGKFLLIQKQGRLFDKKGRQVNRRGYLVDQLGNVINKIGKIIFYQEELGKDDDELPDPYCFEKVRSLKSNKHEVQFRVALHTQIVPKEEPRSIPVAEPEPVEVPQASQEQSVEEFFKQSLEVSATEEDQFIQKLTQPKEPKSRSEFLNKKPSIDHKEEKEPEAQPLFKAMKNEQQSSQHRVEQLQEIIEMKDLQFKNAPDNRTRSNKVQGLNRYVPGSDIQKAYQHDQSKLSSQKARVMLDQDFLGKIESFNKQLDSRRKEFLGNSTSNQRYLVGSEAAAYNIVAQAEQPGLAHKNLSSVYGRVRQKFNQNMSGYVGPTATVHRRVDGRMQELEEIYMRPRIAQNSQMPEK